MQTLAERLMGERADNTTQSVSAVFGSLGDLSRVLELDGPRLRVGLWPIQSNAKPMVTMGIVTLLGFLLEARRDITVYRLVARLDGEPEDHEWSIRDSQFDVDDWGLDDLDENIAIWGNLNLDNEQWTLSLEVENDLAAEPDDLKEFTFGAKSLPDLIAKLPDAVNEIAEFLNADKPDSTRPAYEKEDWNSARLEYVLEQSFNWELQLLLTLWGKTRSEDQVKEDYRRLSTACKELGGELGAWVAANQLKRALLPLFEPLDEGLFPLVGEVVGTFDRSVFPPLLLHDAIYRLDDPQNSYELLESLTEVFRSSETFWLALGRLYLRGQHLHESVDAYQRGIEAEAASKTLYIEYAQLLRQIILSEIPFELGEPRESITGSAFTEDVILTEFNSDDVAEVLGWEVVETYHAALK
ncbi:MAG: hypothetical protein K8I82_26875, partial [Anaerolineae bacterium]|nr:hypothetical protein [Anaerolineae bacterium]